MHLSWRYMVTGHTLKDAGAIDWRTVYRVLPLRDMPKSVGIKIDDWDEGMKHQTFDPYWVLG